MSQPQSQSPSHSKRVFAGLGVGALVAVVIVVVILGAIGSILVYQGISQQPSIRVTSVNIPQPTIFTNPQSSTVVDDGRVANSGTFDYTPTFPGTYSLVFDNSFSSSTKVVVLTTTSPTGGGSGSYTIPAGASQSLSYNLATGERLSGSFSVSGGSGNDIHFYITAQTCTQTVNFSFTLVNSGSANGYATVQFTVDRVSAWNNHYFVAQGQQLPESGSDVMSDCVGHNYNILISQTQKA